MPVIDRRLFHGIIVVVTCMWVVNLAAPAVWDAYQPSPAVNGIFLAIVGGGMSAGRFKPDWFRGPSRRDDSRDD